MRALLACLFVMCLAAPGWSAAQADPGTEVERISQPSALDNGYGAVVISIRSSLWLDDPLQVYFLREGGDVSNDADVVRFERKQGLFSFGNDTTKYKIRAFQLTPGTYSLVGHGVGCPKVPAVNERCLIEEPGIFGSDEWSQIPSDELRPLERRFGRLPRAPEPIIPGEYRLRYGLYPRSYEDDAGRRY